MFSFSFSKASINETERRKTCGGNSYESHFTGLTIYCATDCLSHYTGLLFDQ